MIALIVLAPLLVKSCNCFETSSKICLKHKSCIIIKQVFKINLSVAEVFSNISAQLGPAVVYVWSINEACECSTAVNSNNPCMRKTNIVLFLNFFQLSCPANTALSVSSSNLWNKFVEYFLHHQTLYQHQLSKCSKSSYNSEVYSKYACFTWKVMS